MASKASIILLVLLGAVLFLQVAVADEVVVDGGDNVMTSWATDLDVDENAEVTDVNDSDATDLNVVDDEFDDSTFEEPEAATDDSDAEFDNAEGVEQSEATHLVEDSEGDEVEGADHPLARILHERSSKRCWSKKCCKRFYKKPGCCKKTCVDLLENNKHCGKCGHRCNTKKSYVCYNGFCKKPKKHHVYGCGRKKCLNGKVCCGRQCKDLRSDSNNCGKCGKKCKKGSLCCGRHCKDLRSDSDNCGKRGKKCKKGSLCCHGRCVDKDDYHHCGKCGVQCPYGHKCCYGKCTNISKDRKHCGRCNKPCAHGTKCVYGMCGYGA